MSADAERICVVIGRTRHKMVAAELQEAVRRGARLIELRLDFLAKAVDFKRLLEHKACPLVATLRRAADGGRWNGNEEDRQMILRQAIVSGGFDWVDLETDIADRIPRYGTTKRIISYHNFQETPADLEQHYQKMCAQDADVVKLAVMARTPLDNLQVFRLLQQAKKPTVAHCMGEYGLPSRLLALKYGAPFIYAAFNKERNVAPGLPSFEEVRRVFPIASINAETRVFGVIGDPVAHSLSPLLHNRMFRNLGSNALYLPFRVPRGQLGPFLRGFEAIPVQGYSVTIPHKEDAAELSEVRDAAVEQTQAANTLVHRQDGGFEAFNTDYAAALAALKSGLVPDAGGSPQTLRGKHVLILGAGGVARAIAHGTRQSGASVTIASRTLERATRLAAEVEGKAIEWHTRHNGHADVLINCTPVGMHPHLDESPVHVSFLRPELLVFDTVYTPENTQLLNDARNRGCPVVSGLEMFVRQAALQFRLFTGMDPSLETMRELVRDAISPLKSRQFGGHSPEA